MSPSQVQCAVFGTNGYMTFMQGHGNSSDRKLKDSIEDMNENDAIQVLKSVSAKTYTRIDMNDNKKRAGFIAQDFQNLPDSLGENFVETVTRRIDKDTDNTEEILTLDYDRTSVLLWQCCKNLLARVEALEAKNKK